MRFLSGIMLEPEVSHLCSPGSGSLQTFLATVLLLIVLLSLLLGVGVLHGLMKCACVTL
jgi:hypothetical protein